MNKINQCNKCKKEYFSDNCCKIISYKKNKDILIVHEEKLEEYDYGFSEKDMKEYIWISCSNNPENPIYILLKNPLYVLLNKEDKNQCKECLKIFNDKHKLKQHQNRKTWCIKNKDNINQCNQCLKIFNDKYKLKEHQKRKTSCFINKELFELTELKGEDRNYGGNELFIDMIPPKCWFNNVRKHIKASNWNILRHYIYDRNNNKCECCNVEKTIENPLEAHERWDYDNINNIQKLIRIIALCRKCHLSTHMGYARVTGKYEEAKNHLMKVRNFTEEEYEKHYEETGNLWIMRSKKDYKLDISLITNNGIELINTFLKKNNDV